VAHISRYDEAQAIIFMTASGSYTIEDEHELLSDIKILMCEKNCPKLIVDHRKSEIIASARNYFDRHRDYENFDLPQNLRLAVVTNKITENFLLYENASVNRGRKVKVFTDIDQAVEWMRDSTV